MTPDQTTLRTLDSLSERECQSVDRAWQPLKAYVDMGNFELLLDRESRGRALNAIAKQRGVTYPMVLKDLYRFFAGGMTPMAFVPRWMDCGPGIGSMQQEGHRRRGRAPSRADDASQGLPLTPSLRKKLLKGIRVFLTPGKSVPIAFRETLGRFFPHGFELVDGEAVPVFKPGKPLPTIHQFRNLVRLERKGLKLHKRLTGKREQNLKDRGITGKATDGLFGPGNRFEIDSTIVDIYLVCSFNRRWFIGRAVLYVIVDVWSRAVVGFHLDLEGPSWETARYAVASVAMDKVKLAARYGVTISTDEWPCAVLPFALLGDRGDVVSKGSDALAKSLGLNVENASPFRGDWKGTVERQFRLIQDASVHFMPGGVPRPGKIKGESDARADANLTLHALGKIILKLLMFFNHEPLPVGRLPSEYVAAGNESGSPIELWNWGMANLSGGGRKKPYDEVLTHLLPVSIATVRSNGIHFGELRYTCPSAASEDWFSQARVQGSFKVEFRVDAAAPWTAWVRRTARDAWEECNALGEDKLLQVSHGKDVIVRLHRLRDAQRKLERSGLERGARCFTEIGKIQQDERLLTRAARKGVKKSEILQGAKERRGLEQELNRLDRRSDGGRGMLGAAAEPHDTALESSSALDEDLVKLAEAAWEDDK